MRFPRNGVGFSAIGAIAIFAIFVTAVAPAAAQDKCPAPRNLTVSQIRGQVFDAFGIPVPGAAVLLLGIHGELQTAADAKGLFQLNVPPGRYVMKVDAEGFQFSTFEVKVGRNLRTILRPQKLNVILGFSGSYCPGVTTSRREFLDTTGANLKRLKETSQKDATQK
jgi:hypothetical protein